LYNSVENSIVVITEEMKSAGRHQHVISTALLPKGVHILRLSHDGKVITQKLLRE
jgi:hypothetical protein